MRPASTNVLAPYCSKVYRRPYADGEQDDLEPDEGD
jgi:hypothetical protein